MRTSIRLVNYYDSAVGMKNAIYLYLERLRDQSGFAFTLTIGLDSLEIYLSYHSGCIKVPPQLKLYHHTFHVSSLQPMNPSHRHDMSLSKKRKTTESEQRASKVATLQKRLRLSVNDGPE